MGNIESGSEGPSGSVDSLKHRLQSLEETVRSVEAAHQDAQGHHFPAPDTADIYLYGARLICTPGVRVVTGPVVGEVTANSAVILLEVEIAPELGPTAQVSVYVSLVDDACPRGRVVSTATLRLPSRRPRAFRIGGGVSNVIWPGRAYTVCFGGIGVEDARFCVGRFRTPSTCFEPRLQVIVVSGDRQDRLEPGEPSLWRVLRERVTAPTSSESPAPIGLVLHAGGQVWMGDAFEDAWKLLTRRAMDPLLCVDGGWQEAQEAATERLREAVRRAWNLPDKRTVLSSVANLMLCGAADVHPEFEGSLPRASCLTRDDVGDGKPKKGGSSMDGSRGFEKKRPETRALHATIRACRRVYYEYQGQLLWKAVPQGGDQGRDVGDLTSSFEAEEKGVEEMLAETRRVERDVAVKQRKVAIAEEALRRANAAGNLPAEAGRQAAEERVETIRKEAKAARTKRATLAKRAVPAVASAATDRMSQGAFLNLGGSIGFVLLDTAWVRVSWDGRIGEGNCIGVADGEENPAASPLLAPGAWETLELELSRDSELRLLIVVVRFALVGAVEAPDAEEIATLSPDVSAASEGGSVKASTSGAASDGRGGKSWRDDRNRLLERLFAWKAGEAWREVVLVCGAAGSKGHPGLRSACELEITDSKHPGCTIRQLIAGPITDTPKSVTSVEDKNGRFASGTLSGGTTNGGGFSYRPASTDSIVPRGSPPNSIFANATIAGVSEDRTKSLFVETEAASSEQMLEEGAVHKRRAAPGWDDANERGDDGGGVGGAAYNGKRQASYGAQPPGKDITATVALRQNNAAWADGERSFLEASLDGGHSPATAIAAGFEPASCARGVPASVVAKAVKISFAGATVVLGPVVGRVTQGSAVILVEVGSTAAVGCVLTDGITGGQHRQVCLLVSGRPHAFFFDTLKAHRHYTISLDGAGNAGARTGAFTTLQAWSDRREPPALRAARRLSSSAAGTCTGATVSPPPSPGRANSETTTSSLPSPVAPTDINNDNNDDKHGVGNGQRDDGNNDDTSAVCDVRLLFVSGTGLSAAKGLCSDIGEMQGAVGATSTDMWIALGRELWNPWPQADVVVHTGSQVDLEVAILEALPILFAAEAEEEGSEAREEAEEMAMERIREAYRFQWSLPGARACLSCGSHLMLRGEADLALPELKPGLSSSSVVGVGRHGGNASVGEEHREPFGRQFSAYARHTIARLASQAFCEYQRQLWDPLSVPMDLDINDVGYARGGPEIDSAGLYYNGGSGGGSGCNGGFLDVNAMEARRNGEWHFHVFGETVGLFALDIYHGSAGLQRDERTPLVSNAQWSSLALALSIEEIQAMVIVGDAPFVSDSILDARAKARHPSNAHLKRSWPFHGGELLRLLEMLVKWTMTGGSGGEPREVMLIGGGLRHPLETVIRDSITSTAIIQTICGSFIGGPLPKTIPFEHKGHLSQRLSYRHIVWSSGGNNKLCRHQQQEYGEAGQPAALKGKKTPPLSPPSNAVRDHDNNNTHANSDDEDVARNTSTNNDDPHRNPSCILVCCTASGVGPSSRLLLRSHHFTPASWGAWCDSNGNTTRRVTNGETAKQTSSPSSPAAQAEDIDRPRDAPRWAATAGEETEARVRRARESMAMPATVDMLAALALEGPANVLAEAFERVLDMEEDVTDERLLVVRGGTGGAIRRVFDCVAAVYDHTACVGIRALCPTRPSPIVVRRLILARQGNDSRDSNSASNASRPKAAEVADAAMAQFRHEHTTRHGGARKEKEGKRKKKPPVYLEGDTGKGERGAIRRKGLGLSPLWLFLTLPFHDDETFAAFFCEVLRSSERLSRRFC